ncbi:hypothetical protein [Roseomonas indoligenes]|uniref:Glycine zipper domain-containing protein n=1 Tax=Roseomonas indoligenes TaxID=2820811 RepID=A0A940S3Z6_9PROT|nr:hypothetical protein [Pararoseomonas indoligenes]MBP0491459.1 hypothetical protein [Pararoseomonas indoligenes]
MNDPHRAGFRTTALLSIGTVILAGLSACAPAGPGPYQQQANYAGYACQQGNPQACQDYQALAPAANAEAAQAQQNAVVGTAVAAGVVGAVAGAAIASSSRRGYRNRGYYRGGGGYYRGGPRYHHRY